MKNMQWYTVIQTPFEIERTKYWISFAVQYQGLWFPLKYRKKMWVMTNRKCGNYKIWSQSTTKQTD